MKQNLFPRLLPTVVSLAAALFSTSAFALPGDLYVGEVVGGAISKFTPDGTKIAFATANFPSDIAIDGAGNLFVANGSTPGNILKVSPDGITSAFAAGLMDPLGVAFDRNGNLFVADFAANTILMFTPNGTKTTFASGLNNPAGLAFDAAGNLFATDHGSGTIFKFTPDGTKTTFASGLNQPFGIAFDGAGNLFEADQASGTIFKFAPDGTKSTFASGLNSPIRLAFDSSGNLFESDFSSGTIFVFSPTGTKTTFTTGLHSPEALAFEPTPHALLNISTRAFVGTGDQVLIGGFIVGGSGMVNGTILVRAAGASLTAQGVPGALQDPVLRIFDTHANVIASNDNWKDTQQAEIQATGLAPTDDRESAIVISLPAGAFTAIITGANNTTGIARVDIFNLQ